jgi:hypothetical protein
MRQIIWTIIQPQPRRLPSPAIQATIIPQGSQALGFPAPQINAATPSGPASLLTVTQGLGSVSGSSSAVGSSTTLHSHATGSGRPQDVIKQCEAIRDDWIDTEGEIHVSLGFEVVLIALRFQLISTRSSVKTMLSSRPPVVMDSSQSKIPMAGIHG